MPNDPHRFFQTENARYVSFLAAQQTSINPATGAACPAGAAPGTCFPTYALAGVNTPAVDVTDFVICSSGTLTAGVAGTGNLSRAVLVLSAGPLVAAGLIARYFPETGGRELEQIAPPPCPPPMLRR